MLFAQLQALAYAYMQAADDGRRRENLPTESALEIADKAAQAAVVAAADAAQVRSHLWLYKHGSCRHGTDCRHMHDQPQCHCNGLSYAAVSP